MRTVELVSEWDSVPFEGGFAGLHSLSNQGFSGAVTAGPTQLFMLNGTVVGVLDGDIDAFEDADGTARAAPHDALPLLVVMQDRADEPRAQYYTEETSIADVDRTLEEGKFTGYVELSENVLSGDYYLVYHQGRSMSVAWVGSSERLVTDDEAFDAANGEVGIYQVFPADIEPVDLPEPPEPSPQSGGRTTDDADTGADERLGTGAATGEAGAEPSGGEAATERAIDASSGASQSEDVTATGSAAGDSGGEETDRRGGPPGSKATGASQGTAVDRQQPEDGDSHTGTESADEPDPEPEGTTASGAADPTTETERSGAAAESDRTEPPAETTDTAAETSRRDAPTGTETGRQDSSTEMESSRTESPTETSRRDAAAEAAERAAEPDAVEADEGTADTSPARTDEPTAGAESQTAAEATDSDTVGALETRSIPSLDPEHSNPAAESPPTQTSSQESASQQSAGSPTRSSGDEPTAADQPTEPTTADEAAQPAPASELEAELADREDRIAELEREVGELSAENEELAAERDRLLNELEQARAEIQRLEEQLTASGGHAAGGATSGGHASGGQQLSAAEAIDGTNLFIRYHSKGEATLAKAQDGTADRESVEENLRLEYHTQFDSDDVVVDGAPFEEFLKGSIQYRFVDWLIRGLLYEIRDTGHESAMSVIYDALPEVDRAELNGQVSVTYTEDGQEHRSQERFDVVVRDRMGNPLVVANINDSRQPATNDQMTDIIRNAERVGNASGSLAAAFLVTSSFFEPEALETAREATSSGLFSRDKRKSFVNLSRKGGYHLCLLEARNREFHLAVPEL